MRALLLPTLLLSTLILASCAREDREKKEYTLSGTLYRDCSGQPLKDTYIELFETNYGSNAGGAWVCGSTTTD